VKCFTREIRLSSSANKELIDLTGRVKEAVSESGIADGICVVHTRHTTSAILINEDEGGLKRDIIKKVSEEFPDDRPWLHNRIDNNAAAHVAASFIGNSVTIPVVSGRPCLGTWQSVFFLELDGPRSSRIVTVQVLG